jgi:hypothetical protein
MGKALWAWLPLVALVGGCGLNGVEAQSEAIAKPNGNPVCATHQNYGLVFDFADCPSDQTALANIPTTDVSECSAAFPSWPPGHHGVLSYVYTYTDATRTNYDPTRVEIFGVDLTDWANPTLAFHVFADRSQLLPGVDNTTSPATIQPIWVGTDYPECWPQNHKVEVSQVSLGPDPGVPPTGETGPPTYPFPTGGCIVPSILASAQSLSCCHRQTCAELGASCGTVDDGCGAQLNCGTCRINQYCDTSSAPSQMCTARVVHNPPDPSTCRGHTCM